MTAILPAVAQEQPQVCNTRPITAQFARDNLQRAATEGDLASAQDFADRARRQFDQLAGQARRCQCPPAAKLFEDASDTLDRVQDSQSRRELRELANGAKPLLEEGLQQLRHCNRR